MIWGETPHSCYDIRVASLASRVQDDSVDVRIELGQYYFRPTKNHLYVVQSLCVSFPVLYSGRRVFDCDHFVGIWRKQYGEYADTGIGVNQNLFAG